MMNSIKKIKLIIAISDDNVIGSEKPINGSSIPWKISSDMKKFKELTVGNTVVMGRKTWETIPKKFRPLPGRENVVLTRQLNYVAEGAIVMHSISDVLDYWKNKSNDLWIMGGKEIYNLFKEHVDEMHITRIHANLYNSTMVTAPNLEMNGDGIPKGFFKAYFEAFEQNEKNEYDAHYFVFKKKLDENDLDSLRQRAISSIPSEPIDGPYEELLRDILVNGTAKLDRTGTGTISVFGRQIRWDLSKGFPICTTKKVHLKSIIYELLWFIKGSTNIKYLNDNGVRIWNEWADSNGELGPVYGKQWRSWPDYKGGTIDQLQEVIDTLRENPDSRRIIVSAWNVADIPNMNLPPCHALFQFYVANGKLSCQLYQRSADVFLGVPFNITSYALFTMMVAQVCGLELGEFIHTFGDVHIYANHIDQVVTQINRKPYPFPTMKINPNVTDINDFRFEDFQLVGYQAHSHIKGDVAV